MNIHLLSIKMNMQYEYSITKHKNEYATRFTNGVIGMFKMLQEKWGHPRWRLLQTNLPIRRCYKWSFMFKNRCHSHFTMQFLCPFLRANCVFGSPHVSSRRSFRRIYAAHRRHYELFILTCVYFLSFICTLVLIHRRYWQQNNGQEHIT